MALKLNDEGLVVGYIKNMLATFPLPTYIPIEDGALVIEEHTYIYKGNVVKAPASGWVYQGAIVDGSGVRDENSPSLEVVDSYVWGEEIPQITSTYTSATSRYDLATHLYLGKFLRLLRSEKGLNLMPFYNCAIAPLQPVSYHLSEPSEQTGQVVFEEKQESSGWETYLIPITPGYKYTVGVDSAVGFEAILAFADRGQINVKASNKLYKQFPDLAFPLKVGCSTITQPTLVPGFTLAGVKDIVGEELKTKLDSLKPWWYNLCLVLRVPSGSSSQVAVLEGDYRRANQKGVDGTIPSKRVLYSFTKGGEQQVKQELLSPLSLLQPNVGQRTCLSSRLIEYLSGNVVWSGDPYWRNIERVNNRAVSLGLGKVSALRKGVWNAEVQSFLYNQAIQSPVIANKVDLTGNVDKDVERILMGGGY